LEQVCLPGSIATVSFALIKELSPGSSQFAPQAFVLAAFPGKKLRKSSLPDGKPAYDVMHVEHLRERYGLFMKSIHPAFPLVWDSVDCISLLFRKLLCIAKNRSAV
jgi:hypothetical protein